MFAISLNHKATSGLNNYNPLPYTLSIALDFFIPWQFVDKVCRNGKVFIQTLASGATANVFTRIILAFWSYWYYNRWYFCFFFVYLFSIVNTLRPQLEYKISYECKIYSKKRSRKTVLITGFTSLLYILHDTSCFVNIEFYYIIKHLSKDRELLFLSWLYNK